MITRRTMVCVVAGAMLIAGCGSGDSSEVGSSAPTRPTVVVSTNILGDVVENIVGDAATVITIMPVGSDPHDFQPSAQQIAQLNEADAVIVNGGGFEQGLLDIVESAENDGVPLFEAISAVETLESAGHDHGDEHHDEGDDHGDEHDESDEHDEEHYDEGDPHFFTDPDRMASAVGAISEFLIVEVDGIDAAAVQASADTYIATLVALDEEIEQTLSAVSPADRVLVTNHEVFTYFADRYSFEIIGSVIPGGTTLDSADAETLAALALVVEAEDIPAVLSDTSSSDELARTLALEAGNIEVVALYSESLGGPDSDGATYLDMMRVNAERIAEALTR
jgi:zinc/manganese transport system substrate-binding protein